MQYPNTIEVPTHVQNTRIDAFLAQTTQKSRGELQKHILAQKVLVNGKIVKPSYSIKPTDIIEFENIEDRQLTQSTQTDLNIIFEDDYIIVINKPSGIQVHPDAHNQKDTLIQAVVAHYPEIRSAVYDPKLEISRLRPGVVHRLDKDTSGIIVIAKNIESLHNLSNQFHSRLVQKKYLALLYGELIEQKRIETYIKRKPTKKNMMGISNNPDSGKLAVSNFTPKKYYSHNNEIITEVSCSIETGRTHQIRVHAKYIGHPVLGDALYYNKASKKCSFSLNINRQLLHASEITILHPNTNKPTTFSVEPPTDYCTAIQTLTPKKL